MKKKKRKRKSTLDAEFWAQFEKNNELLLERIAYHRAKLAKGE